MKARTRWIVAALVLLVIAGAVARTLSARKAATAAAAVAPVVQPLDITAADVAVATRAEMVATLELSGSLKAVDSAMLKAKVATEVREILVREGDSVRAGQLIGRLDDTEFRWRLRQAEDQAAAAQAQLDIAQRQLTNNQALVNQGFISQTALESSASSTASAKATLQAAKAAAEIARKAVNDTEIRAPLSGLVSQRLVQPGERVGLDAKLIEIVDLSRIELEAAVPPEDVLALRVGQVARLQIDGLALPATARVARINPSTQAGTRAVMVYLAVDPVPGLRQGLFSRGVIELQRRTALVVPVTALRFDQARPYVTRVAGGQAKQRLVTTGARGEVTLAGRREASVEITDGLAEGDTVLRGSVGALRDGTPLRLAAAAVPAVAAPAASAASR
jgi:membrane fusion protein, multidrug efflux system